MCIPYIFLNFIFLLITTSSGFKRLYKSLVISCPNTSLITFTAWVLETLLPSALGPKFSVHKAKPDRSLMVTVCSCPGQSWHHNHAWQDNSWCLGLYLTLTGLFTARSSVKPPQDSYTEHLVLTSHVMHFLPVK